VGNEIDKGAFQFDYKKQLHHVHEGSIGNLCNDQITAMMQTVVDKFGFDKVDKAIESLLK
jgi:argininosuccinate lyase